MLFELTILERKGRVHHLLDRSAKIIGRNRKPRRKVEGINLNNLLGKRNNSEVQN
jgi:hypothetical protein